MRGKRRTAVALVVIGTISIATPSSAVVAPGGRLYVMTVTNQRAAVVAMSPDGSKNQVVIDVTHAPHRQGLGTFDVSEGASMIAVELAPHIYLANIDGSNLHRLDVPGEVRDPSFSPDGTQLVFSRYMRLSGRVDVFRAAIDGSGLERLTGPGEPSATFPEWSPDGTAISFINNSQVGSSRLMMTNPSGTSFTVIKRFDVDDWDVSAGAWSPRSSRLVFSLFNFADENDDLWTIHRDGSHLRQITFTPDMSERFPTYSPDGSKVACIAGYGHVVTIDADGGHRHRIATRGSDYFLDWE